MSNNSIRKYLPFDFSLIRTDFLGVIDINQPPLSVKGIKSKREEYAALAMKNIMLFFAVNFISMFILLYWATVIGRVDMYAESILIVFVLIGCLLIADVMKQSIDLTTGFSTPYLLMSEMPESSMLNECRAQMNAILAQDHLPEQVDRFMRELHLIGRTDLTVGELAEITAIIEKTKQKPIDYAKQLQEKLNDQLNPKSVDPMDQMPPRFSFDSWVDKPTEKTFQTLLAMREKKGVLTTQFYVDRLGEHVSEIIGTFESVTSDRVIELMLERSWLSVRPEWVHLFFDKR